MTLPGTEFLGWLRNKAARRAPGGAVEAADNAAYTLVTSESFLVLFPVNYEYYVVDSQR